APQQRAHPGEEFGERERLYQIIVRAQLKPFYTVAHAVAGSKKKNWRAHPIAPQFRDHFPAVFSWQHDIHDKKVEPGRAREVQTGFAIARKIDNEARFAKSLGQKSRGFLFVLDDQNSHRPSV